jgi:vitamin B12 transporter
MSSKKAALVLFSLLLAGFRAVAQDAPENAKQSDSTKDPDPANKPKDIVISASRMDESTRDVASDITVIPSADLQKAQHRMVADALREVAAVDINRTSGPGTLTAVFMRGADPGDTLVLIDGVIVNDPISNDRSYDFANLTTDNIQRIEVLRGPQSVLYGSDAVGGVISIITRQGSGDPHASLSLEGGSFGSYRGALGVSGGSTLVNYSFGASHFQTAGIKSSFPGDQDRDGYRNDTFSGKVGVTPCSWFNLDVVARGTQSSTDLDNGGGPQPDDPHRVLSVDQWLFRVAPRIRLFDDLWEQTLAFSLSTYDTHDDSPPDANTSAYAFSVFRSRLLLLDWQNTLRLSDAHAFVLGLAYRQESGSSSTASFDPVFGPFVSVMNNETAWIGSAYGEYRLHLWDRLTATAGARLDDHKEFGSRGTYRGTLAYVVEETDTKLRSTIGTGFKAPSLFELFSSFGDPNLKPEQMMGWDAGFDQGIAGRVVIGSVSYFRNNFRNLIDFDSATNKFLNVGRAGTSGVETALKILPLKDLEIRLSYTFTDTKDKDTGEELVRRARHKAAARVDYAVTEKLHVNASYLYVGARKDFDFSTFPTSLVTLPDYALLNLAASYKITEKIDLFIRGDNILDRRYQEVLGFPTPGAGVYGGASIEF